ncbi:MAG: Na+/H+ antiporter NhaA [Myxococcales bacterium]|nr:Na+/H+ antiporter NhaA [Myxococcales bacterium]
MSAPTGNPPTPAPRLAERIARPFVQFMDLEIGSAVLLLSMTAVALLWANSPYAASYEHLLHEPVAIAFGSHALSLSVHHWINDGLMAIFFFLVGMEIKREMVMGDLSSRTRAMLPVMGALGGMVFPAGIYAWFHWGGAAANGWGIPMATDIAFAVAAMSVLGRRVPPPLKVFLLALAIADDLGAVLVIAVFYTETIHLGALGLALGLLVVVFGMNKAGVRSFPPYWAMGAVVWLFMHESGVHATIAGVALGLITPARPDTDRLETMVDRGRNALEHLREWVRNDAADHGGHKRHHAVREIQDASRDSLSPLDYLTNRLEKPVLFVIMPLFALANAGVALEGQTLSDPLARQVAVAVAAGLLIGKPLGITLFSWVAVRTGLAVLPRGVGLLAIAATGMLAGIGFTVALFIAALAFGDPTIIAGAKIGILVGSVLAAVIGLAMLSRALPDEPYVS